MSTIGVLVMAYGGPASLQEIPGYLADIRSGRPTSPEVLAEITENYRRIGGSSPLLEISERQAVMLQERLGRERFTVYLGMRHWAPWIEDVVAQMVDDGIARAVSIVLAPHYSEMSVRRYQQKIADGLEMHRAEGAIEFRHVDSYHDNRHYLEALHERLQQGLALWPEEERTRVHVIWSAHSLPKRILSAGDPYDWQLRETAALLARKAGIAAERWSWSYQSAGKSSEPWLGPDLPDHLEELARSGVRNVLVQPIGFVSDHVEILFDIDIEAREAAEEHGVRVERPPALNDSSLFIDALAEAVSEQAAPWL